MKILKQIFCKHYWIDDGRTHRGRRFKYCNKCGVLGDLASNYQFSLDEDLINHGLDLDFLNWSGYNDRNSLVCNIYTYVDMIGTGEETDMKYLRNIDEVTYRISKPIKDIILKREYTYPKIVGF